jgi:hypothetical protein
MPGVVEAGCFAALGLLQGAAVIGGLVYEQLNLQQVTLIEWHVLSAAAATLIRFPVHSLLRFLSHLLLSPFLL